ncbi:MAG: Long-chain-fatty-acid--AMP ligase FadD32 [Candidatus Accumulibacter appositus]|uniref:Long-chain-fatty-acid--AMP ligase FadD32 n=1 Tax=Candidatus Accumulibacter appositus TaxID=1454003 RepID=A0A011PXS8_9PROT|nr:AMP-binding protein [Accumulibacter sp.]EXI81802.1 MAG: Long-chain-fatty-acid--AMP ligase FadD32 [Candidatus Accumulibacter appositus]HRF04178.1 AMP-binding protein [Accumulibacter sp.]
MSAAQSQEAQPQASPMTSERLLGVLTALVAETRPGRVARVGLGSHLERDLGLDSLARVELLLRVGIEFGCSLPEAALAEAETAQDLLRFIATASGEEHSPTVADASTASGPISVPTQAMTLVDVFEWHVQHHPQRTHVLLYGSGGEGGEFRPEAISYADLFEQSRRIATGLVTRGLLPRQTVALMLPTSRDYLSSFFGVLLAGGIPVPIYPPARLAQIEDHLCRHARILANAEAVFIITVPQAKGVAALLRREAPSLSEVLTPAELDSEPIELLYRAQADDIAFLQYTSGSTGDPKGVVLSHANLLANVRAMGAACEASSDDVFISWLPLYHDMGLIGAWFCPLYFGMPLVLMSPLAFLSRPVRWLRAISDHRGTISPAPNFAYELCARKIADADLQGIDLSSWRLALNGAEPVSPATLQAFGERFAPYGLLGEAITPVYGLAECSVGLAFPALERGPLIDRIEREELVNRKCAVPVSGSDGQAMCVPACGRALPGHEIRIVDAEGCELPDRCVGRLQFHGPSATRGYYRNPQATQALISDGWLDSGDFAYTVAGEIYLTGRVKDLIIRGGRNLYPYELEQAVGNIPGVRKGCVAVFASKDARTASERLVILAETREQEASVLDDLRQKISDAALDEIGMPADEIVLAPANSVLKTSSGKIRRNASRDAYENGLIGAPTVPARQQMLRLGVASLRARLGEAARRFGRRVYGVWCWSVFLVLGVPTAAAVVLLGKLLRSPASGRRLVHRAARLFFALAGIRLQISAVADLPTVPHLLLVNHCSYLDALALCAALPPSRAYAFVAKRELVEQPAIHAFLSALGTLFVERFAASRSAEDVDEIAAALRRGQNLVIFPEGTFSREAGLKPFRMGAFVAAARAGTPVVVAGLCGSRAILRDQTWMPRRGRLALTVGSLLAPAADDWSAAVGLRDAARKEMLGLCGEHDLER